MFVTCGKKILSFLFPVKLSIATAITCEENRIEGKMPRKAALLNLSHICDLSKRQDFGNFLKETNDQKRQNHWPMIPTLKSKDLSNSIF